jgi:subtilase family serine protease
MSLDRGLRSTLLAALAAFVAACGGADGNEEITLDGRSPAVTVVPEGTIRFDEDRYRAPLPEGPREVIVLTVADANLDVDPGAAGTVTVAVGIAGSTVARETVTLTESGPDTGVFLGTIRIVAGAEIAGNSQLEAKDQDTIVATYHDADDGSGRAVDVEATALVDNHTPDLTVSALAGPAAAAPGAPVTVSFTVRNDPRGGAAGPFEVALQLLGPTGVLSTLSVPVEGGLAAGATFDGQAVFTAPAAVGAYSWKAIADAAKVVEEFDEGNNTRIGNTLKVGPDLFVASVTGPETARSGERVTVEVVVANAAGASGAGGSVTKVELLNAAGAVVTSQAWSTLPLGGGQSVALRVLVYLPTNVNATYTWRATADAYNQVTESDESNNVTVGNATDVIGADLSIVSVTGPATAKSGERVTVNVVVANAAGAGATSGTVTTVELLNAAGAVVTSQAWSTPAVAAGTTGSIAVLFYLPTNANGTYTWRAKADSYSQVAETDEGNNVTVGNATDVIGG